MVAVGNIIRVWTAPPENPLTKEELTLPFEQFFGRPWDDVMMDAALPFAHHSVWECYFAVAGLQPVEGLLLSELTAGDRKPHNLLIG